MIDIRDIQNIDISKLSNKCVRVQIDDFSFESTMSKNDLIELAYILSGVINEVMYITKDLSDDT